MQMHISRLRPSRTSHLLIAMLMLVLIVGLGLRTAQAHGGATGVIKERMDAMDAMKKAVKPVAAMMRGEARYDAATVQQSAQMIRSHAGDALTALFPRGSTGHPSEALAEIWSDWPEFQALANRLETLTDALAAGAARRPEKTSAPRHATMGAGMPGANMMGKAAMPSGSRALPLSEQSADELFKQVAATCTDCHKQFRMEKAKK